MHSTRSNVRAVLSLCRNGVKNLKFIPKSLSQAATFSTHMHSGVYVLRMPMLSPTMAMGRIVKWQVPIGTEVKAYDLLLEVSAMDLIRDTTSEIAMDIEIMEDGTLVRVLQQEGDLVSVGQPIALLCEDADRDVHAKLQHIPVDAASLSAYPTALWQAYVKTAEGEVAAGKCS